MAEMLIVMGIVAVLTTLSIGFYTKQRDQVKFNDSISKILNIIQTARTYASTSKSAYDSDDNLVVPEEGYGVYFEKGTTPKIILFANTGKKNGDDKRQYTDKDTIEEAYNLPSNVSLTDIIAADEAETSLTKAVIIFKPPLAEVEITDNALALLQIDTLRIGVSRNLSATEKITKYIRINRISGFPEFESQP